MTILRQKLKQELVLRGYSPKTKQAYTAAVSGLAQHYHRSPDRIDDPEIKAYLLALHTGGRLSASTLNVIVSGQRFFYKHILQRPFEHIERALPRVKKPIRRPRAYSQDEIRRLLTVGCPHPKHRAFLMTVYSAGLRLSEACRLQTCHIESSRMLIRVEQGKGKKDRYTLLSPMLLKELRAYWRAFRPKVWLFPSRHHPQLPLPDGSGQKMFYNALERAGLPNKGGIHSLRHSFATHLLENGVDVYILKRLMGHSSLSTTAGYLHVSGERMAQVRSPLDSIGFASPSVGSAEVIASRHDGTPAPVAPAIEPSPQLPAPILQPD